jgi:hypothetical protein
MKNEANAPAEAVKGCKRCCCVPVRQEGDILAAVDCLLYAPPALATVRPYTFPQEDV